MRHPILETFVAGKEPAQAAPIVASAFGMSFNDFTDAGTIIMVCLLQPTN
jgi:hypothetical protein